MGINVESLARGIGRAGLNSLKANEDSAAQKIFNGIREFGDDVAGGSEIWQKLTSFSPTKAEAGVTNIHMNEEGMGTLKSYQDALSKQQQRMAEQMNKYDPATRGTSNESTDKMYEKYKAQHDALQTEIDRTSKALVNPSSVEGGKFSITTEPGTGAKVKNLGENIKNYYTEGDAGTLATRAGVTAGVYGAGAVGLRYASGGNLTTNSNGESDIAGIPFI